MTPIDSRMQTPQSSPLVSVVLPFYNTAEFLAEAIDSVLAQTYQAYELILVDNVSTDGSSEIAASYVGRDPRIRLVRNAEFVGQVANYNGAVRHMSTAASYLKILQADDVMLPNCLEFMVACAEAHPSANLIASYYLRGPRLLGESVRWPRTLATGREAARLHLLEDKFMFGTPSTLMFRASMVRRRDPFFPTDCVHEDTELAYEEIQRGDVGFVHQVLTYLRVREGSFIAGMMTYDWQIADFYVICRKFGPRFMDEGEHRALMGRVTGEYHRALARAALFRRAPAYWAHHAKVLRSCGESVPATRTLLPHVLRAVLSALRHPVWALEQVRWAARERAGSAN